MSQAAATVLTAALTAGLLGSGHCFAMCGGLAASLGALAARKRGRAALFAALQFNGGRVSGYVLLGTLAGAVAGFAGGMAGSDTGMPWFRLLTGAMIGLIGLRLAFGWRALDFAERAGTALWLRVAPLAQRAAGRPDAAGRLLLGLAWAFLPCGLVYSSLLLAASTGSPLAGAATMLAFGLGTLPAMLGLTIASPALAGLLGDRGFRRFAGLGLLLLALWVIAGASGVLLGHAHPAN